MVISVHVPRCAGNTFLKILRRFFMVVVDDFYEVKPQNKMANCIMGHFVSTKYDKIYPKAHKITWIREPIERLASNYLLDKRADWPMEDEFSKRLRNGDVNFLEYSIKYANGIRTYLPEPIENYEFIGITSIWNTCLREFLKKFTYRKRLTGLIEPANVQNYEEVEEIVDCLTEKQRKKVKELNKQDYEFYEMVKKHWKL